MSSLRKKKIQKHKNSLGHTKALDWAKFMLKKSTVLQKTGLQAKKKKKKGCPLIIYYSHLWHINFINVPVSEKFSISSTAMKIK